MMHGQKNIKLQNTSLLMPSTQLVVLRYSTQICDYILRPIIWYFSGHPNT